MAPEFPKPLRADLRRLSLLVGAPRWSTSSLGEKNSCRVAGSSAPPSVPATRVDRTSGVRVTNFYRNNEAYWAAERQNGTLDRDNDRIACEKR